MGHVLRGHGAIREGAVEFKQRGRLRIAVGMPPLLLSKPRGPIRCDHKCDSRSREIHRLFGRKRQSGIDRASAAKTAPPVSRR